jgi:uncharacterized protein (TIGR02117 family)
MIQNERSALSRVLRFCGVLLALSGLLVTATVIGGPPALKPAGEAGQGGQSGYPKAPRQIFVASNGWHSAIFVARAAIPGNAIPVLSDFPLAAYLGFGWGDAEYFPTRDPGIWTMLNAAFRPTPSVLHVTGLSSHPRDAFPKDEVVALTLSDDGFRKLLAFLNAAFQRDPAGRVAVYAPGLHAFSKFYRARGKFDLFNNCNNWTARGLAAAGLPIQPDRIFRAQGLMAAVREIAK